MPTAYKINGINWDLKAFKQNEKTAAKITRIYNAAVKEAARIAALVKYNPNKPFTFKDYPQTQDRVNKLLQSMAGQMELVIQNGTQEAWAIANAKNDALLGYMASQTGIHKDVLAKRYDYGARNEAALKSFQQRKADGMGLSDRIWKHTKAAKSELETALDIGLSEGKSAAALSRDVRNALLEPDKLFRRVRDKDGKLQLSKAAQEYNPGQGIYRSSYKNAMRLTRTENNMAYREADFQRWSQMDFVKGYEIKLSNNPNHCDVCKTLAGKYPKTFKFVGWHPQCRCFAIPILLTPDEYNQFELATLRGEEYAPSDIITDIPEKMKRWLSENKDRIARAKSLPYFIRDNAKLLNSAAKTIAKVRTINLSNFIKGDIPTNAEVKSIFKEVASQNTEWFRNGVDDFKFLKSGSYMMQHSMPYDPKTGKWVKGSTFTVSTNTFSSVNFNPADELKGAFAAIKKGGKLTFNQEYSIESLWHEILHARTKSPPGRISTAQVKAMETVNQFTARHTYSDFLESLGGKATHKSKILDDGYGYSSWIKDFRKRLKDAGISEQTALKELQPILMSDYKSVEVELVKFFRKHKKTK